MDELGFLEFYLTARTPPPSCAPCVSPAKSEQVKKGVESHYHSADSRKVPRSRFSLEYPGCSGLEASTAPARHQNPYAPLAVLLRRSFKRFRSSPNMFKRSFTSKDRVGKLSKPAKRSFNEKQQKMLEKMDSPMVERYRGRPRMRQGEELTSPSPSLSPSLTSAIITVVVGQTQRLFAAHEDVLSHSPFFAAAIRDQFFEANSRRIFLPDEEPEIFSCILEYLYKGDYYPCLIHDKRNNAWMLEGQLESPKIGGRGGVEPTIFHSGVGDVILRDTAVYCAADRYGLEELKRLSLRKQGLQSGIEVGTILRSARYAYENTPDSDSRLRAHYLALIIRSRKTFKRSGTMQMEMEIGGKLFFDLFVAMCNHIDDLVDLKQVPQVSFPG